MSLLAALLLAAAARVESVYLTTTSDQKLAVRVSVAGTPGLVRVHREGDAARVSIADAELGGSFAGGRHFSWTPAADFDRARAPEAPARIDRLELEAAGTDVGDGHARLNMKFRDIARRMREGGAMRVRAVRRARCVH